MDLIRLKLTKLTKLTTDTSKTIGEFVVSLVQYVRTKLTKESMKLTKHLFDYPSQFSCFGEFGELCEFTTSAHVKIQKTIKNELVILVIMYLYMGACNKLTKTHQTHLSLKTESIGDTK